MDMLNSKPLGDLGRLLTTAVAVFIIGLLNPPAMRAAEAAAAAPAAVAVDQQPLTVRPQIPPDIVLMLDDSGSMSWNFMPDICYLQGVTCSKGNVSAYTLTSDNTNAALINAANNGVYYNPTIKYDPPTKADGTAYGNSPGITGAWADGFSDTTAVDVTAYAPASSFSSASSYTYTAAYEHYDNGTGVGSGRSNVPFSTSSPGTTTAETTTQASNSACTNLHSNQVGWAWVSSTKVSSTKYTCVWNYTPTYTYFEYATGATNTVQYVASAAQGCHGVANCVTETDVSGTAAPAGIAAGQNIANWFSYYRSRMLMAKSGLMQAFDKLDPTFRLGFGSINDNNSGGLPTNTSYNSTHIATVSPFGKSADAVSQRKNFWSWVVGETPGSSTPLRIALDAVGKYYQDASGNAWTTMSSDPVPIDTAAMGCRQAYSILTTDGFWNETWSSGTPGNADGTKGSKIAGPNGQSYTYTAVAPYSDSNSSTLADVAMKYWKTDLQSTITNEVPPSTEDPAFWQHMTTFTMGLGFTPTGIAPSGTTIDQVFNWTNGGAAISGFSWPTPSSNSINNIADLAHAGVNGHGGFFSATDPQSFASGITSALKRATERVGTGASLAANSTQLQTGTAVFQANYFTAAWKGDLKSLAVDAGTGAIASTPTWSAASAMPAAAARTIMTYNTATGKFVAFANSGGTPPALSSAQLSALDPTGTNSAANEVAIVNYMRGDTSQEQKNGGNYRSRDWVLGDIVDSQPVYAGAPNANEFVGRTFAGYSYDPNSVSSATPFHDWAVGTTDSHGNSSPSAASTRTPLVYVASNDGMLHAFNASSGAEVYAYLPGALMVNSTDPYKGLSEPFVNLSNPGYGSSVPHQFYNDGELTIADAYVQLPSDTAAAWHTILVGTTGRGPARAVYALDVTDPANITPLWERYANDANSLDSNSGYIGQMVGKPVIAQTGDFGTNPAWSVLIGNGYNSPKGTAALLQFDLATGQLYVHATDSSTSNGLAAPVAWMNYPTSGMADVAYAGDLLGRMWSFPLIKIKTTGQTTSYTSTPAAAGTSLFTAKNASNVVEPITGGTIAGQNPADHSVWVFFGTGKYLTQTDTSDKSVQSWYGLEVQSSPGGGDVTTSGRSSLVQRQIIAEQAASGSTLPVRAVTLKPSSSDMTGKNGWYIDLVSPLPNGVNNPTAQGERMVVPNQFQGNLLLGTTRIPQPSATADPCNPAGGGWIMALDPFTGTNPQSNFFDTNGDNSINGSDTITVNGQQVPAAGIGFSSLPNAPIFVGVDMFVSFDNGTTSSVKTSASAGGYNRVSWQEIVVP